MMNLLTVLFGWLTPKGSKTVAMTAAQYKTKFDSCMSNAESAGGAFNTQPEVKVAWAQAGAVYGFLWLEKSLFDKKGLVPSAAADAYAVKAEVALGKATTEAASFSASTNSPKAVAWAQMASNYAYAWAEMTKVEAP